EGRHHAHRVEKITQVEVGDVVGHLAGLEVDIRRGYADLLDQLAPGPGPGDRQGFLLARAVEEGDGNLLPFFPAKSRPDHVGLERLHVRSLLDGLANPGQPWRQLLAVDLANPPAWPDAGLGRRQSRTDAHHDRFPVRHADVDARLGLVGP